jgi:hypothetical protein
MILVAWFADRYQHDMLYSECRSVLSHKLYRMSSKTVFSLPFSMILVAWFAFRTQLLTVVVVKSKLKTQN